MSQALGAPAQHERVAAGAVPYASLVGFMCGVVIGPTVWLGRDSDLEVAMGAFAASALLAGFFGAALTGTLGLLARTTRSDAQPQGSPFVRIVLRIATLAGPAVIIIGLVLLPVIALAGMSGGEPALVVFGFGAPISLIAIGCGLTLISRRAMRYSRSFVIAAPPGEVVAKVAIWGSSTRRTEFALRSATVTFTRRYRPVAWGILVGTLWLFLWVALGAVLFPDPSALIAAVIFVLLGVLFLLVRTTETLTVEAMPIESGSDVMVGGQAAPSLIRRLERLMSTSPTGR